MRIVFNLTIPSGSTQRVSSQFPNWFKELITKEILVIVPDDTNSFTITADIKDDEGYTRWSQSGIAKNSTNFYAIERIIRPNFTVGVQATAGPASNLTVKIIIETYQKMK